MAQHNQEDLERVFGFIKNGKTQGSEGQHWEAAGSFLEARVLLQGLAQDHPTESEEEQKIQQLYQDQSGGYFYQSRESLIEALQEETKNDKQEKTIQCQNLSEDDARKRNDLFATIFSKPIQQRVPVESSEEEAATDHKKVLEKQLSLEDRLMELNANLPTGLKTSHERMQDLNQGMKRLGLGAYTTTGNNPLKIDSPKSASQQVEDIIAQAKDEVAMKIPDNDAVDTDAPDNDSIILSDDDSDLVDDDVDSILSDEILELQNVDEIRDEVAATQAKLVELLALMEVLPSGDDIEEHDDKESENFKPAEGKQKLNEAKTSLHKALKLWKVKAKPIS